MKVTIEDLRIGVRIRVDFTGLSVVEDVEEGVLLGEIFADLWISRFDKRGLVVLGTLKYGDIREEGWDLSFDDDQVFVNPTSPTDWSEKDLVVAVQISEEELINPDLDVEGGLFPVLAIVKE